jgi:hypothetical protein
MKNRIAASCLRCPPRVLARLFAALTLLLTRSLLCHIAHVSRARKQCLCSTVTQSQRSISRSIQQATAWISSACLSVFLVMSTHAWVAPTATDVFGMEDVFEKILGYLDVFHLHVLGQTTKMLRKWCFNKVHFSKLSNQSWESRGDAGESIGVHDIQRLCCIANKVDHLSFIRTLDLWLEDLVVEHCEILSSSLRHVTHLRLCCEQLCDLGVSYLTSGFTLLDVCHLITCPLLTPLVFGSFQSLPSLTVLRLESCSGIKSHPLSPQMLQQALSLMTSLRCLELNDSVSSSNVELLSLLCLSVCNAPQPLRIHCEPKSCIDEPFFQYNFHCEFHPLGLSSFVCVDCGQTQLLSERYVSWFAQGCLQNRCEFLVFAFPHDQCAVPSSRAALRTCPICNVSSGFGISTVDLVDDHFQFTDCPHIAIIPVGAESKCEQQPALSGFCYMRRSDGLHVPKTKSRQRQLWYACM